MHSQYSLRSPAVKRLMREAQELSEATETYYAHPLDDNLFEWHFTIRGPEDTEFEGGIYHGRIVLPPDYPMKPPSIILLTPNGRFEVHKKICLSISGHHPESWQPSWSIRTALLAIIGFMPTHGNGAIGSLDYSPDERKVLARRTLEFRCSTCGPVNTILKPVTEASKESNKEAKELAQQIDFKAEKEKKSSTSTENTPPVIGENNLEGAAAAAPIVADPFPGFGAGNPFPMIPPFMNPMFSPPTTTAEQGGAPAIPPQFFMPPFWPPNMQPDTHTTNAQTHPQGGPQIPAHAFWPPGFNPMMPPGNMNMPNCSSSSLTTASTSTKESSSNSEPNSSSSPTVNVPESKPTTSSATSSNGNSSNDTGTNGTTSSNLDTNTASTDSSAATENSSSESSTTAAGNDSAGSGIRHRSNVAPAASQNVRYERTIQNAELPHRRQANANSGWCMMGLMFIIGLLLLALIIRRLIMMKILNIDLQF